MRVFGADHHAIGLEEILHAGSFLEELRVVHDAHAVFGATVDAFLDFVAGPDGYGAFEHDDFRPIGVVCDLIGDAPHGGHVRGTVVAGRGADGDENDITVSDALGQIHAEPQPAGFHVRLEQFRQTGFIDRTLAPVQCVDFVRVLVDSDDFVSGVGQTRTGDQTHISRADDSEPHASTPNGEKVLARIVPVDYRHPATARQTESGALGFPRLPAEGQVAFPAGMLLR